MWPVRDTNCFFFCAKIIAQQIKTLSRNNQSVYRATNCNISHGHEREAGKLHARGERAGDHFKEREDMASNVEEVCVSCLRIIILKILCLKEIATDYEVVFKTALCKICQFELEGESL